MLHQYLMVNSTTAHNEFLDQATTSGKQSLGRQVLVELFDCDDEILNQTEAVRKALTNVAKAINATVVDTVFHRFSPHGVSGVVVIAESHIAVHTWPEYGYAAVDVFTCSDEISPSVIREELCERFSAQTSDAQVIHRGILHRVTANL